MRGTRDKMVKELSSIFILEIQANLEANKALSTLGLIPFNTLKQANIQ